jgi:hypothetical protein
MATTCIKEMALVNLKYEQLKWILKFYLKMENMEYPSRSPDLTPDFFLWGALKNAVYTLTPRTLQDLRREIEIELAAVPLDRTSANLLHVVVKKCIAAGGGHFEHL